MGLQGTGLVGDKYLNDLCNRRFVYAQWRLRSSPSSSQAADCPWFPRRPARQRSVRGSTVVLLDDGPFLFHRRPVRRRIVLGFLIVLPGDGSSTLALSAVSSYSIVTVDVLATPDIQRVADLRRLALVRALRMRVVLRRQNSMGQPKMQWIPFAYLHGERLAAPLSKD